MNDTKGWFIKYFDYERPRAGASFNGILFGWQILFQVNAHTKIYFNKYICYPELYYPRQYYHNISAIVPAVQIFIWKEPIKSPAKTFTFFHVYPQIYDWVRCKQYQFHRVKLIFGRRKTDWLKICLCGAHPQELSQFKYLNQYWFYWISLSQKIRIEAIPVNDVKYWHIVQTTPSNIQVYKSIYIF